MNMQQTSVSVASVSELCELIYSLEYICRLKTFFYHINKNSRFISLSHPFLRMQHTKEMHSKFPLQGIPFSYLSCVLYIYCFQILNYFRSRNLIITWKRGCPMDMQHLIQDQFCMHIPGLCLCIWLQFILLQLLLCFSLF